MASTYGMSLWNEIENGSMTYFVVLVRIYSENKATTLKADALIAYPAHVVLLKFIISQKRYLIDNGFTLVGFLPLEIQDYIKGVLKKQVR